LSIFAIGARALLCYAHGCEISPSHAHEVAMEGLATYEDRRPVTAHLPPDIVIVTTTYLHIPSRVQFRPTFIDDPSARVVRIDNPSATFYRFLYSNVGRDYHWIDRFAWSDEQLRAHLSRPTTTLLVLYVDGHPAGYVELDAASSEPGTEVAYFGLIGAFHGRGLGKHLLSIGVQRAFEDGAERVWVHTCSLDGRHALANYCARGFIPYHTARHEQSLTLRQAA
jgi:GNAT superfamily N-acetyltransferase